MCTTVPPAKSSAPHCQIMPPRAAVSAAVAADLNSSGPGQYQTMCAIGQYANVNHSAMNTSTAENFMRSANAPTIRQQVIAANVAWNATNTSSGRTTPLLKVAAVAKSPFIESNVPDRNSRLNPPKNAFPSVNARL